MPEYRLHHHPATSHQQIAAFIRRQQGGPILDVGAAGGFLGQLLQGTDLVVDAVEPDAARAVAARPFYRRLFESSIESADLPERAYRIIVCADVLEHTVDPAGVLRQLRRAATEDALVIVSVPNVAHLAVRLMLLTGRFPKMDRGILDRTHLHFFTRTTAEDLLRSVGLQVKEVLATSVPLSEVWPGGDEGALMGAMMRVQSGVVRVAPRLFAFQWIFVSEFVLAQTATPRQ